MTEGMKGWKAAGKPVQKLGGPVPDLAAVPAPAAAPEPSPVSPDAGAPGAGSEAPAAP